MTRSCTVCAHDEAHVINVELVSRVPYRDIAGRFGLSKSSLKRHSEEHIPQLLVKARDAVERTDADDLLEQVRDLQDRTIKLLDDAEGEGDIRAALSAIREARGNVELLARMRQIIDERPQINLYLSPEWMELRALIVTTLEPFSEARECLVRALEGRGNGSS